MEEKDVYEEITNVFTAKSAKEMLYYLYAVSRVYDGREVKRGLQAGHRVALRGVT